MAVPFILSMMMAGVILFFVVACSNFSVVSILYGAFLLFLYARMTFSEHKKAGSGVIYRRIFLTVYAVVFCISFIGMLYDERGSMAITAESMATGEIPFCHIAIPQVIISFFMTHNIIFPARVWGHTASVASMLCIWFIFTITIGRGWCSWVCFYGGWEEGFSHIGKKRRINLLPKNKELREFHFGFFAFIILVAVGTMSAVYCEWFCPFKLVTEFNPLNTIPNLIGGVLFIGLFLGLVVVMPILSKRRTQCSTLCPFGAFASLTNKISLFKVKIDTEKCKGCMKCAMACPFGSIDIKTIQEKKGEPEITCARCGECMGVCSENAISYAFALNLKKGGCGTGCGSKQAKTKFGKGVQEFFSPANLFRFAAFTFAAIMSGSWAVDTFERIITLVAGKF